MSVTLVEFHDRQDALKEAYNRLSKCGSKALGIKDAKQYLGDLAASTNRNEFAATRLQSLTTDFLKAKQSQNRFHVATLSVLEEMHNAIIRNKHAAAGQSIGKSGEGDCFGLASQRRMRILNLGIEIARFRKVRFELSELFPVTNIETLEIKALRDGFKLADRVSHNLLQKMELREQSGITDWTSLLGRAANSARDEAGKQKDASGSHDDKWNGRKTKLVQFLIVEARGSQKGVQKALVFLDLVRYRQNWIRMVCGSEMESGQMELGKLDDLADLLAHDIELGLEASGDLTSDLEKIVSLEKAVPGGAKMPSYE